MIHRREDLPVLDPKKLRFPASPEVAEVRTSTYLNAIGEEGLEVLVIVDRLSPEQEEDRAVRQRFAQKVGASGGASDPSAISHVYHTRQLTDFVQALETGRPPLVDGREGRKAVEVILAVYRSAETGRVVELPLR